MAQSETVSRPFGMRDKMGYFIGNIGNDLTFSLAASYFMVFYSDIMGVSPAIIGTLFGVARLVDAFTDLGMGAIADNSPNTKNGKFKPWIKRVALPVGIASMLMYNIYIMDWSMTAKIVYMFISYILWGSIAYTAINIPYGSLASVISNDPAERAQLSTFRSLGSIVTGILIGIIVPNVIYTTSGEVLPTNFFILSLVMGALAAGAYLACYFMVEERVTLPVKEESFNLKEFFADLGVLVKDKGFLGLMLSTMFVLLGLISVGQLIQYLYMDYFQNTTYLPIATISMTLGGLAAAPFVGKITERFGKKEAGSVALIAGGLVYIVAFFFRIDNPLVFALLVLLSSLLQGYYTMAMYAYVTDVIDDYQVKNNDRKDGTIYSVYSFIRKVGQALAGLIAGSSLTWIGYQTSQGAQSVVQAPEVQEGIYSLATLIPGTSYLLAGLVLLFLYPLSKKRVEENNRVLESREQ